MSNVDSIKNSIIFPFESSIDALSYFELNSTIHLVKEALFISVGGEYTPGQINSILKILDHAKGLALSNDNDRQGKYFNCKILVAYILKLNIEIELEKISKDSVTIGFDNQYLSIFKNIANIKTFGTIDASMSRVGFMFDFDVKKMGKIEIFLLSIIADLKSDKIIYINNPIEKDFNDDLMKKKGLVKSKVSQAEARENNRVI
jgi:hypothetical protein